VLFSLADLGDPFRRARILGAKTILGVFSPNSFKNATLACGNLNLRRVVERRGVNQFPRA